MNIRIAIFDDDPNQIKRYRTLLNEWMKDKTYTLSLSLLEFNSVFEYTEKDLDKFDALMLDIKMPGISGMDFAHEIRKNNNPIPIVFISDYIEFGLQGYEVGAVRFLHKSDSHFNNKFFECMDYVLSIITYNDNSAYTFKDKELGLTKISHSDILYIEVYDHILHIHTLNIEYTERKSLEAALEVLPDQFVRCSRYSVVNMQHAKRVTAMLVELSTGIQLKVTKQYAQAIMESFIRFH